MQKTYVVAPNFSISPSPKVKGDEPIPSDGRYQLGDILTDPFGPKPRVLNRYNRTRIPTKCLDPSDEKGGVTLSSDDLWSGQIGIWGSILASLGIGASVNLSVNAKSHSTEILTIKTLETVEFDACDDYVRAVLASEPVDGYIKEFSNGGGKAKQVQLYMISGLKIAKEASSTSTDLRQAGGGAGVSAEAAKAKAKLAEVNYKRSRDVSFETSKTDFVLAFQLVHILYEFETRKLATEVSVKKAGLADVEGAGKGAVRFKGVDWDLSGEEQVGQGVLKVGDEESPILVLIPDLG